MKNRHLFKHDEQSVDSVDYREAEENLKKVLQPVIEDFTYLMEQHKTEEKKSLATKQQES